jgi:hypothetical protein
MAIHPKTIYSKTPKGVLEMKNKTTKLPRDAGMVFLAVDGKSTAADLLRRSGMDEKKLHPILEKLVADGFIRVFTAPESPKPAAATAATLAAGSIPGPGVEDDLDFTSPTAMSKLNAEAESRAKAEADAKARALAAARAAAEAKVRQEAEARARSQAEAKAQSEAEARAKAEAAVKAAADARTKAEAEARSAADARAKAEAEGRIKAAMEAKARAEAEAKARAEAEARAKAEAERKAAAEARAKQEAESRAKAEIDARARAEAEAKAKAAVEAQMKALQEALNQAEKRAKQEAEERARVEAEIKTRQAAERKAREEAEARAKAAEEAVSQARAMAEEAARAKAAAEAKVALEAVGGGGEAARAHMESALKALEEAKAKARAEAEARTEAERRARAEAQAREREEQEHKQREEKERKAREEAEARTKAQLRELQDQARRAKEEAEAKAAVERKAREEAEARIDAERKAREEAERKAAAEAKAREEMLAKARIEAEAKARAEVEAMIQAERKAREEAELRAQQEIAARAEAEKRARAEAERQGEVARKAREEAVRKSREIERSGDHSPEARRARAEVERIARQAEEAVAQARAQAEEERKARAAAEDRAKMEAVARVMQEQQLRSNAEDEIKSRVQAEIKAREQAEIEAESRYRQEALARAKAAAEERRKRDADAKEGKPVRYTKPTNWTRTLGISAAVLLVVAIALLHVVPLNNFVGSAQSVMSKRLGVPVTIANVRYALLPFPELTLERVGIGKLQETKAESIVVSAWPWTFLADTLEFDNVEVNALTTDQEALALVPGWLQPQSGPQPLGVRRVQLRSVRLTVKNLDIPGFNGDIALNPDGALQRAVLSDSKIRVEITPRDNALRVGLEGRNWKLPVGPPLEFEDIVAEAVVEPQQATITGFTGKIGRATIKGSTRVSWGSGIRVEGDFTVVNGELAQLMSSFTRDFTASGTLTANATYALAGTNLQNLFADPRVEASFNIEKGAINNVDIIRAIQTPSRDGTRGGKTGFNSLSGSMRLANQSYYYRQLQLSSGPMNASGAVDVAPNGDLSGRISTQLGSKTVIVARGNLLVTGNLKTPVLK